MVDPLHLLAAAIVGTIAVARATRLVTSDGYPPAKAVRDWWIRVTHDGPWSLLAECPFCFAPYAAAADLAWAAWVLPGSDPLDAWSVGWWWWIVNGWAAVSYLAAMIVVRDEPPE